MKLSREIPINKDQLLNIIAHVKTCIGNNRDQLFEQWVQSRLDKSLKQYYNQLAHAFDKLSIASDGKELKILRRLIIE